MAQVTTNGGTFSTSNPGYYRARPDKRGCDIKLMFTPNDLVVAPKIGMIQTVTTNVDGAMKDTGDSTRQAEQARRSLTTSEEGENGMAGRKIDRMAERTNPVYGANNPSGGEKELGSTGHGGNTAFGKRTKKTDGTYEVVDAWLTDGPTRNAVGKTSTQVFETTAMVLEGDMAGTYLGSVSWGYQKDTSENITLTSFAVVKMGVPSTSWMKAAEKWNQTTTAVGGVDEKNMQVPTTSHQTGATPTSKTGISKRLMELRQKKAGLDTKKDSVTIKNIDFEIKVLEAKQAEIDRTARST